MSIMAEKDYGVWPLLSSRGSPREDQDSPTLRRSTGSVYKSFPPVDGNQIPALRVLEMEKEIGKAR